jgi:hypothetical protein
MEEREEKKSPSSNIVFIGKRCLVQLNVDGLKPIGVFKTDASSTSEGGRIHAESWHTQSLKL